MKPNVVKVLGIALPLVGAALTLVGNKVDEIKLDTKITDKVAEALKTEK